MTSNAGRLSGKVALVTGGSRGIGLGAAKRFVEDGARVCITGRRSASLEEAVESLGGPACAIHVAGSASDPEHREAAIGATLSAFGRLDILVNNAGMNPVYGSLMDVPVDVARKMLDLNTLAALAWTQDVVAAWMGEHGGDIVNVSSTAAFRSYPGLGMYGVTKAALSQLTSSLAAELGPKIRVNAVAPALIRTDFAHDLYEGKEDVLSTSYPVGRLGTTEDTAGAIAFLVGPDAAWLTGEVLVLDGGSTLTGSFG